MVKRARVRLSEADRDALQKLVRSGRAPARMLTHARILLEAEEGAGRPGWPDAQIAEALETSVSTVERVRKRYGAARLQAALQHRPPRATKPRKLNGHAAAHLIALSRSAPTAGRDRWTMRLLAERIVLVMDNLNTHSPASLYQAFPPAEAMRLADKLEIHPTPTHGSWLNMAEVEPAVLAKQCLDRRIPDLEQLASEVAAWEKDRNRTATTIDWRFTTADARTRLKRLYPTP